LFGAVVVGLGAPSCLDTRDTPTPTAAEQRCASCHGDPLRGGDYLSRAAPPFDLLGRTSTRDPGVGAHALHLQPSATHAAVACTECHIVPDSVDQPGHADDDRPAELRFGKLARSGEHAPSYDAKTRTCQDSYCHGQARPHWTAPRSSDEACGSCHGLPPALPHPQSERCSVCHGDVIDAQRHFVAPKLHVNGQVQYTPGACRRCHGSQQSAAPPQDVSGNVSISALGVGAHQAHLNGGTSSRPLACEECHRVPRKLEEATHADGLPAEVMLSEVASVGEHQPSWDRESATCLDSFCHSPSPGTHQASPVWNRDRNLDCQGCHGLPPPAPHPQLDDCSHCHGQVVGQDNRTIIDRARHVDGHVDVSFDESCSSCHGDTTSPAPPRDVRGNLDASAPGVGAHRAHVLGSARARAVPCEACHEVPSTPLQPGHLDTPLPAEVVFSGAALARGAAPSYQAGSCRDTSCHGAVTSDRRQASGGTNTAPQWTGGSAEAKCGSCHGLPPPPPHPFVSAAYPCHSCHADLGDDDVTFTHPELHVDGSVTFQVP
jgi:predicted CxxxxCH...CXXCH cytochrome family protein